MEFLNLGKKKFYQGNIISSNNLLLNSYFENLTIGLYVLYVLRMRLDSRLCFSVWHFCLFFFFFDQRLLHCSWDMNSALRQMNSAKRCFQQ